MASYNYDQRPGESTQAYYKRLAKVADQRLVRLEKLSTEKGFKGVKDWAYAGAMKDISRYRKGATRFNIKISDKYINDAITDIKHFLDRPTSNKTDIVKFYKKRAETLNKSQDTNFTWQELADLFENKQYAAAIKYPSGDTLRVFNSIKQGDLTIGNVDKKASKEAQAKYQGDMLASALKETESKKALNEIIHTDDKHVKDTLIYLLQSNKIDPHEVFTF